MPRGRHGQRIVRPDLAVATIRWGAIQMPRPNVRIKSTFQFESRYLLPPLTDDVCSVEQGFNFAIIF
jgi:hypothetical protein